MSEAHTDLLLHRMFPLLKGLRCGQLGFARYDYGLLNHCDQPINSSRIEGLKNKIKAIKPCCCGFHNLDYSTLKINQASPRSRSP